MKIRRSSTLAYDEGVVFVTHVPHSPIQVMGRRDPRTCELCVAQVYETSLNFEKALSDPAVGVIEIVTGAEAERLLAQVYADITMGRTGAWKGSP